MKYLIAGLGNIGEEYKGTRHNIGFDILNVLAEKLEISFEPKRYGDVASAKLRGRQVFLLKPSTYMNLSGNAVRYWLQKELVPIENLLVICDDIALPLGKIRLRYKGSDAGHNGLANIIYTLGTHQFSRLRLGIGNDFAKGFQMDFVLGKWYPEEIEIIKPRLSTCEQAIQSFVLIGIENTMNLYNK